MVAVHVLTGPAKLSLKQPDQFGLGPPDLVVGTPEVGQPSDRMRMFVPGNDGLERPIVGHKPALQLALDAEKQYAV